MRNLELQGELSHLVLTVMPLRSTQAALHVGVRKAVIGGILGQERCHGSDKHTVSKWDAFLGDISP